MKTGFGHALTKRMFIQAHAVTYQNNDFAVFHFHSPCEQNTHWFRVLFYIPILTIFWRVLMTHHLHYFWGTHGEVCCSRTLWELKQPWLTISTNKKPHLNKCFKPFSGKAYILRSALFLINKSESESTWLIFRRREKKFCYPDFIPNDLLRKSANVSSHKHWENAHLFHCLLGSDKVLWV